MEIEKGNGKTQYGPGISITLTSEEIARAIDAFLISHDVCIVGPRTININNEICMNCICDIYVDPSGFINTDNTTIYGDNRNHEY